jgi:hypothetical protein
MVVAWSSGSEHGAPSSGSALGSARKGSAGGFSAALSADLALDPASDKRPRTPVDGTAPPFAADGGARVPAVDAQTISATDPNGITDARAPSDAAATVATVEPQATKPEPAKASAEPAKASAAAPPAGQRGPTKVPAELAAVKFDLEPNWDRDYDGAGTFGFELRVPKTQRTKLFVFQYGYDDPRAPVDRDQYLKWMADAKVLTATLNRQRGAAWYLEGKDGRGVDAFRYVINYGGKHLICFGSLYKDAASNTLGDLRDKVLMQAKKICETLSL